MANLDQILRRSRRLRSRACRHHRPQLLSVVAWHPNSDGDSGQDQTEGSPTSRTLRSGRFIMFGAAHGGKRDVCPDDRDHRKQPAASTGSGSSEGIAMSQAVALGSSVLLDNAFLYSLGSLNRNIRQKHHLLTLNILALSALADALVMHQRLTV